MINLIHKQYYSLLVLWDDHFQYLIALITLNSLTPRDPALHPSKKRSNIEIAFEIIGLGFSLQK